MAEVIMPLFYNMPYNSPMIYTNLLRPLLFRLDPETAHNWALRGTAGLARFPTACRLIQALARPKPHPVRTLGLTFPNPIGLAGGMDKNGLAPFAWWAFGFGFIELGTVTPKPQSGNDKPRMFRLPESEALINRMGFNNDGAAVVANRLQSQTENGLRPAFPIGISVGKNKLTSVEQTADDYATTAQQLAPHADFITINVSSPNTPGLRSLQTPAWLTKLVESVCAVTGTKPVLVKVSPELSGHDLASALEAVMTAGAAGVIGTNTLGCIAPNGEPAGKSGRPLREIARERVAEIRKVVGDKATVIGCGGIDDAASVEAMRSAGADLVQIYTGLVYRGPFLPVELSRAWINGRAAPKHPK
jgi:dihydroorotate dehydrogenase